MKIETYYFAVLVGFFLAFLWLILSAIFWTNDLSYAFILFGATLISCYMFNVIKQFVSENPEYSIYHFFLLLAGVGWCCAYLFDRSLALTMDLFLMSFSIAAAAGRLGCYHAGCCFGKNGFPTQITESLFHAFNFIVGIVLLHYLQPGLTALIMTASYAVFRFWIELLRADDRSSLWGVSEAQYTGTVILFVLLLLSYYHYPDWTSPILYASLIQVVITFFIGVKWFRKKTM